MAAAGRADSKVSVLMVEDDELDVLAVRRALRDFSDRVDFHSADNGRKALELLQRQPVAIAWPLVVILDLNMPEMNGFQFLDVLRADKCLSRVPVIMFTTSDQDTDIVQAYDRHVVGYVKKELETEADDTLAVFLEKYLDTVIFPKQDPRA